MLMARTTTGSSTHGTLYELDAIAAVVIGGTLLIGGRGTIVGTVLGVLIFTTLDQRLHPEQPVQLRPGRRQGRDHRRSPSCCSSGWPPARPHRGRAEPGSPPAAAAARRARRHRHRRHRRRPQPDPPGSAPPDGPPGSAAAPPDHLATEPGRRPRREHVCNEAARIRRLTSTAVALSAPAPSSPAAPATPRRAPAARRRQQRRQRQRRARREGHHRLLRPRRPTTAGSPRITNAAKAEAEKYDDVDLKVAEGTNDVSPQISQVETFINDKVDAIVLLPFDGAALTDGRDQGDAGRHPGHQRRPRVRQPVRRPRHVLGDNYGMGVSAGTYICEQLRRQARTPSSPRSPASTRCR